MKDLHIMVEQKTYEILRVEAFKNRKSIGCVIRELLADCHIGQSANKQTVQPDHSGRSL